MTVAAGYASLVQHLNQVELTTVQDLNWTMRIAERALRTMLRDARRWAPSETMGPVIVGKAGDNLWQVELAFPCGPGAEHSPTTSYPNVDYYNRCIKYVWRRLPNLWFGGQWHTHPFQAAPLPSPWDMWGANLKREVGWFAWNEKEFGGRGHLEIIMAAKATRGWWITTNPDRARLILELPIGIQASGQ